MTFPLLLIPLLLASCSTGEASGDPSAALAGADKASTDKYTTEDAPTLEQAKELINGEGVLQNAGTLRVSTLSDAPPNIFLKDGIFTGFDNELLREIGARLGLSVEFAATDFAALLSQVQNKQFDVGSSSISTTDKRRQNVGFTNGYDFGYMAVVTKNTSEIKGFKDLNADTRLGVVQGTVQDDYVTSTLGLEPVRYPDYNTVFTNVKNGQVDAWVAPSQQAQGQVKEGDGTKIAESVINTENFTAWAVNSDNKALIDSLNAGLETLVNDGTWCRLAKQWYPEREVPNTWKPGSKASSLTCP